MADVWQEIASEFLHLYPRGRRMLAIAGVDAGRSLIAADALAEALVPAGQRIVRAHVPDVDEQSLRADVVTPFRDEAQSDRILIVSGPSALLAEGIRGVWNFAVWQLAGDEPPHTVASAIVDMTDPENPTRRFTDYCALPASYGS